MKIEVDRPLCGGLGVCESIAPDHFQVGDDGQVVAVAGEIADADRALVEEAASSCPNMVLRVVAG